MAKTKLRDQDQDQGPGSDHGEPVDPNDERIPSGLRDSWRKTVRPNDWDLSDREEVYSMLSAALYACFMGQISTSEAELVRRFADCALKHNPQGSNPTGEVENILRSLAMSQPSEEPPAEPPAEPTDQPNPEEAPEK